MPTKPARILLLDDNLDVLAMYEIILKDAGHFVVATQSVAEARSACDRESFDVIVCDLTLADGSGLDLFRELKVRCGLRGIAVSGWASNEDIGRSLEAGFATHLSKPVELHKLEEAIADAMES